jgi:hypothetical protein
MTCSGVAHRVSAAAGRWLDLSELARIHGGATMPVTTERRFYVDTLGLQCDMCGKTGIFTAEHEEAADGWPQTARDQAAQAGWRLPLERDWAWFRAIGVCCDAGSPSVLCPTCTSRLRDALECWRQACGNPSASIGVTTICMRPADYKDEDNPTGGPK